MDISINQEINKHIEWIEKIASLIGEEELAQEELDKISQHDNCELGHWLSSDSSKPFKDFPEFQELIHAHDEFHKLAGTLIAAFNEGDEAKALDSGKQFIEMSQKVIGYLQALQAHSSK